MDGPPRVRVRLGGGPREQATLGTGGPWRLFADGRLVNESSRPLEPTDLGRTPGGWTLGPASLSGEALVLETVGDSHVLVNGKPYRGSLRLLPAGGGRFHLVNVLDMERYLAGVLSRELYPNWHRETYRAQAVAARTFALFHLLTRPSAAGWDLGDNQASQCYGGVEGETPRSRWAVEATRGRVMTVGPNADRIFMAQYSACCGGRSVPAEAIRSAPDLAPLAGGRVCEDCSACPRYAWGPVRVSKAAVYRSLLAAYPSAAASLGGVREVRVKTRSEHGRAIWVEIIGANRRPREGYELMVLRAEDLRLALLFHGPASATLNSMNCDIRDAGRDVVFENGRGWGHGVGLCQWGAEGKARRGWSAERIIDFYYPGATVVRVYE